MRFAKYCLVLALALDASAGPLVSTVDAGTDLGWYSSMQLRDGKPVVSYYDNRNGQLKLATCTAGCVTAAPTWVVTSVDRDGSVGWYSSLQLNAGNPVVAYYDINRGALKLATCTAACASENPTWVISVVDSSSADVGRFPSLQLNGGNPVIAYRDRTLGRLKLATCTAGCASAAPTWIISVVDGTADVGRFASMQLSDVGPVIGYYDFTHATVKVATCTGGCATASPTWVTSVVDTVPGEDAERQFSLRLDAQGRPAISYYDGVKQDLKLAMCTSACATAGATWLVTTVDGSGDAGSYSSLRFDAGRPVLTYMGVVFNCQSTGNTMSCHTAMDLRLAICPAGCASAAPTWIVSTIDNSGLAGYDPSLQLQDGKAMVTYQDFLNGHLKYAVVDLAAAAIPPNYTALWWNFDESGWGINFNHQGDIVFGTLFTYDASGDPMWLVLPAAAKGADATFSGTLYRTTGPAFNAVPFTPIGPSNVTAVGSMTVSFSGDTASLGYTVDGIAVDKTIRKQVFGTAAASCRSTASDRAPLTNYQDLWWNAAESGWGVNLTQQGDIIFATLFTYDAQGRGTWFVAPATTKQDDGSFAGDLYTTQGPPFNAAPFRPIGAGDITKVGTMRFTFANGERGTMTYSVNAVPVVKSITRQVFSGPLPACTS